MKRILLVVLLLGLCAVAGAAEKADSQPKAAPQQYQVDVTIRFNSLSMAEFAEVQGVLDKLAKQSCKTTIELTKLEAVSFSTLSTTGTSYIYTYSLPEQENKEVNE